MCIPDHRGEHAGGKKWPYEQRATEPHSELPTFLKNYEGGQQNPHFFTLYLLLAAQLRLEIALSGARETRVRIRE